ncbi:PASTA domain-containing protein [Actinoplanes sp. CA-015351]|uniref:PASTA domain-containing protein n=1 Tax=Actinoplanes sp. CA-015351 TaxID=3239897 RepID=UPI003D955688
MADERPPEPDETTPMEPVEASPTEVRPGAADDATRIQPSGGPRSDDRDNAIWTGRAEVRPPRPGTEYYESDWADPRSEEPRGRWWAPIAVGTAALVLLGLLGFGIAVIVQNSDDQTETPATTPATVATTAAEPTTAATTEPTTEPASPSPTLSTIEPTTEPANAEVTVPALRGMPVADAQSALQRTGLTFRVIQRASDAEPGTVIDSDPPEGSLVPSDTRITLVVSTALTSSPVATTTSPTEAPAQD